MKTHLALHSIIDGEKVIVSVSDIVWIQTDSGKLQLGSTIFLRNVQVPISVVELPTEIEKLLGEVCDGVLMLPSRLKHFMGER